MRSRPLSAIAGLVCFASAPSDAVDGVVEINQTCAIQTGCFASDGAGLPVKIDGSAGLSYRLTSDLVVSDVDLDGIVITVNDVSVDLGGFRIRGPNTCAGTPTTCALTGAGGGVRVNDPASVTGVEVSHGSVLGMGRHGIELGRNGAVRDMRVSQCGLHGIVVGEDGSVSGSAAADNGGRGILAGPGASVIGCTASRNRTDGIAAFDGVAVSACTASQNGGVGIYTDSGGSVTGSVARDNAEIGIRTAFSSVVTGSSAFSNGGDGISVLNGTIVSNSASSFNAGDGISASEGSLIVGNSIRDNGFVGLWLNQAGYRENAITSNTLGTVTILNGATNLGSNFCTDDNFQVVACP